MTPLLDSHCHFDDPSFDHDRAEALSRAVRAGVRTLVVPAVTAGHWDRLKRVTDESQRLFAAYGLHPMFVAEHRPEHLQKLAMWVAREQPVAIGECGLDYFVPNLSREAQEFYFVGQLKLAKQFDLPVVVHARRALDQVTKYLRQFPGLRGVIHSFSGSLQQAETVYRLGFKLGIGGAVTYERAQRLRRVVAQVPADALLLETDSPDQPGAGHRGQRNEPAFLPEVLGTVAALRGVDAPQIAAQSNSNAHDLFGISSGE